MKKCFFCGDDIGKTHSLEHVFPNSFLKQYKLQSESTNFTKGHNALYSRIKVPSHKSCNNNFGSRYEKKILEILKNISDHKHELLSLHERESKILKPSENIGDLLSTWFIKIFMVKYGLKLI